MFEMLVATAIVAGIALVGLKQIQNTDSLRSKFEDRYRLDSVGYDIKREIDCSRVPKSCANGSTIAIYARDGSVLIAADKSTQKKGWSFAAQCTASSRFEVRVAKLDKNNKFFLDPISKKTLDWTHPQAVVFPEGTLCSPSAKGSVAKEESINIVAGEGCLVSRPEELPCHPPQPPACGAGSVSTGLTIDTFGGGDGLRTQSLYGQRWLRYCTKIK